MFIYIICRQIAGGGPEVDRKLRNAEVALAQSKKIDYYKILEVKRSAQTTTAEIKKSYKRLALVWHPDKHAGGYVVKFLTVNIVSVRGGGVMKCTYSDHITFILRENRRRNCRGRREVSEGCRGI